MLGPDILNELTDNERDQYAKLENLFMHPGWALAQEIFELGAKESYQRAAFAQSWEQNRMAVGEHSVWSRVVNLSEYVETNFRELAHQRVVAKASEEIDGEEQFE